MKRVTSSSVFNEEIEDPPMEPVVVNGVVEYIKKGDKDTLVEPSLGVSLT